MSARDDRPRGCPQTPQDAQPASAAASQEGPAAHAQAALLRASANNCDMTFKKIRKSWVYVTIDSPREPREPERKVKGGDPEARPRTGSSRGSPDGSSPAIDRDIPNYDLMACERNEIEDPGV